MQSDNELKKQIAEEERLIRIYEAQLALLVKRKKKEAGVNRAHETQKRARHGEKSHNEDIEWLETLDVLQSNGPSFKTPDANGDNTQESTVVPLKSTWHDDALMYRLLPMVGGVAFSSARALRTNNESDTFAEIQQRPYELKGRVHAANATPIKFTVLLEIEITEYVTFGKKAKKKQTRQVHQQQTEHRARICSLELQFIDDNSIAMKKQTSLSPHTNSKLSKIEELDQLASVASETCSLPHALRQLVCWAEFDAHRTQLLDTILKRKENGGESDVGTSMNDNGDGDLKSREVAQNRRLIIHRTNAHEFEIRIVENDDNTNETSSPSTSTKVTSKDQYVRLHWDANCEGAKIPAPHPPRIRLSLRFSWKWKSVWYGRAKEELNLLECYVSESATIRQAPEFDVCIREIQDPQGLTDLLHCCGGSCASAIRILMETLLLAIQR